MALSRTSKRQKRLYGLRAKAFPPYLRDEMEMDPRYMRDLAKDPAAAQWLSNYNEETLKGVRIKGEQHVLNYDQWRECNANRVRKQRARDPVAFHEDRRPISKYEGSGTEDETIERIDTARAVALRRDDDLS